MSTNTTNTTPPPPPPPFSGIGCEDASACAYFDVSDREIVTSLGIFACMGAVLLVTFGGIRHKAPIFFGRRRLRNLVGLVLMRRRAHTRSTYPTALKFFF